MAQTVLKGIGETRNMAVASEQALQGQWGVGNIQREWGGNEYLSFLLQVISTLVRGNFILSAAQARFLRIALTLPFILYTSAISKFWCVCLQSIFRIQPLLTSPTSAIHLQATSISVLHHCNFFLTLLPASLFASVYMKETKVTLKNKNKQTNKFRSCYSPAQTFPRFFKMLNGVTV